MDAAMWNRVGELADRAARLSDLRHHRLQLVAASRLRARGAAVPDELKLEEQVQAAAFVGTGLLLRRIRELCDGRLIVMKGREAGARWPNPRLRPAKDVDLLAEDPEGAHAALLAGGFVPVEDLDLFGELHHLAPLLLPGLPLTVEIHRRPHWPAEPEPTFAEIAAAAVPSALGVEGILAPCAAHHAVLLAGHAWSHEPLGKIGSLADIAALADEAGAGAAGAVAEAWGVGRIWTATARAIDELLGADARPARAPIWKRHLPAARERTVFEDHVARFRGPLAAAAPGEVLGAVCGTLRPTADETWSAKLRRSMHAVRHPSARRSVHEAEWASAPRRRTP